MIRDDAKENAKEYLQEKRKERRQIEEGFFNQSVDYRSLVLSPAGYEEIAVALYAALIPYLAGLSFLFLFIARAQMELFIEFNLSSFLIIWAIGYEVCAALVLIGIFISWVRYLVNRWDQEQKRNQKAF